MKMDEEGDYEKVWGCLMFDDDEKL